MIPVIQPGPSRPGKPKVGFFGITGCAGCLLSVVFNENELLEIPNLVDIKAFPFIKQQNMEDGEYDIIFIEGTVAKQEDLDDILKLRKQTKLLVAMGACSCTGGVPAFRNFISDDHYRELVYHKASHLTDVDPTPVDHYVHVDYYLPGCPPDKNEILNFLKAVAKGKIPKPYDKPVCVECRLNGNRCLLDEGKLCFGPITRGGCNSVCTNNKLECWGCRGPTDDANVKVMLELLKEKGFDTKVIRDRLETFVGLKVAHLYEEEK